MSLKTKFFIMIIGCLFSAISLAVVQETPAALGESADSVASDQRALSAGPGVTTVSPDYTVQEVTSDAVTVREYVSPSGIVFALAWNGLVRPDLTVLLGSYADEYETARSKTPRMPGRRNSRIETQRVVVETWGHMRDLHGRAYAPALVPQGVAIDEIK